MRPPPPDRPAPPPRVRRLQPSAAVLARALVMSVAVTFGAAPSAAAQRAVEVVAVRSQPVERTVTLSGELAPFQRVTLHARASGYVEQVLVDRGSRVRQGQLLARVAAPEVTAQRAEAEARLAAAAATADRLRRASATPGAIAGNELVQADRVVDGARAAARAAAQAERYLRVTAPFAGVVTARHVHPGALVGPGSGSAGPLLDLEQVARLRLVVAVPEAYVGGVRAGTRAEFRVPAHPGRTFAGAVARVGRSLDPKTRTMPVELDVPNAAGALAPGMFAQVAWPASRGAASLLVPPTAVVTTTERTFVVRVANGRAEWVDVRRGGAAGELVEVVGPLHPDDVVVRRATDELRPGEAVRVQHGG